MEIKTEPKNPVVKSENDKSDSPSDCSGGGSPSSPSREKEELERFRNFWSSCNDVFEDDEIEIKEELNTVIIEDLVVEEFEKRRKLEKVV